jgi:hypothetical protein
MAEASESLAEASESLAEASESLAEASESLAEASESLAEASESLAEAAGNPLQGPCDGSGRTDSGFQALISADHTQSDRNLRLRRPLGAGRLPDQGVCQRGETPPHVVVCGLRERL